MSFWPRRVNARQIHAHVVSTEIQKNIAGGALMDIGRGQIAERRFEPCGGLPQLGRAGALAGHLFRPVAFILHMLVLRVGAASRRFCDCRAGQGEQRRHNNGAHFHQNFAPTLMPMLRGCTR
ncbi:hypothetical protein LP420_20435 [Massilia sp. B-10]|nr:hypothetical protein LP420_20435 [Massilia sp. B-10]